ANVIGVLAMIVNPSPGRSPPLSPMVGRTGGPEVTPSGVGAAAGGRQARWNDVVASIARMAAMVRSGRERRIGDLLPSGSAGAAARGSAAGHTAGGTKVRGGLNATLCRDASCDRVGTGPPVAPWHQRCIGRAVRS